MLNVALYIIQPDQLYLLIYIQYFPAQVILYCNMCSVSEFLCTWSPWLSGSGEVESIWPGTFAAPVKHMSCKAISAITPVEYFVATAVSWTEINWNIIFVGKLCTHCSGLEINVSLVLRYTCLRCYNVRSEHYQPWRNVTTSSKLVRHCYRPVMNGSCAWWVMFFQIKWQNISKFFDRT